VPFLNTDFNPKDLKSNAENIVIKNNKYYITKKLKSPSNPKNPLQPEISSKDDIPSLTYTLPSRTKTNKKDITTGKTSRGYSPRRDQENTYSPKFFVDKQQPQTPPDLFEDYNLDQLKPDNRAPLVARQINGNVDSPKTQPGYGKLKDDREDLNNIGKKTENKEQNLTLEKKFLDLIGQVGRVTQQLDQIRPSASTPQNDNLSTKRRRINFSLY